MQAALILYALFTVLLLVLVVVVIIVVGVRSLLAFLRGRHARTKNNGDGQPLDP